MTGRPSWLRTPRTPTSIDWGFIGYWAFTGAFVGVGVLVLDGQLRTYLPRPDALFGDGKLYLEATRAWVEGRDPWLTTVNGVRFAGPPTTLLLNLPLLPFGPDVARYFWATSGLLGWVVVIRRLELGPWWLLFPPFLEGWFPGSPDPALACAIVLGGGAVAAIGKPYSLPAMLGEGRFSALLLAALVTLVTIPLLPWAQFFHDLPQITATLDEQSRHTSAWGDPLLMAATAIGLVSLGPSLGLSLVVPTLWPSAQFHYAIFSVRAGARSAFLGFALALPGFTAVLVVIYAAASLVRRRLHVGIVGHHISVEH